jgi:2,3,4,5-tetrahydropyridine-2-carboxylate N-succinyltransferase
MNQKNIDILKKLDYLNLKSIEISLDIKQAVLWAMEGLNNGDLKIVEKVNDEWVVNHWVKLAILLSFSIFETKIIDCGESNAFDKFPSKFANWSEKDFLSKKIRVVPGGFTRYSTFIDEGAILMPSFINVGARVGKNTMIDTWSTIGSCAYIGNNVHISGGVGIGGVLEPLQANPVIIEDGCFIGARSEIAEGVIVEEGAVISMGCYIGKSTKIIDRETGEISYGRIPKYSVVIPGSIESKNGLSTYCVIIVKKVDEQTRKKVSINELLRS